MTSRANSFLLTMLQRLQAMNLFGPIFSKEIRVASRRRRNYVLRTLYVIVLTFVVVMAWYSMVAFSSGRPIDRVATMSRAAVGLLCTIAWFQFIALQLLAPVMTSTAISDEITHGTLGPLMMTPINSLQIVTGKLFSRLLLMILLVATTLPVLAIIRVFGGIEWHLVLATVSITLCAALFSAAISLTFSVFHKRAYVSILMTFAILFGLYALLPLLIGFLTDFSESAMVVSLKFINPFAALQMVVVEAIAPGTMSRTWGSSYWYVHCAAMLGLTSLLVILSASFVRRAALRQAAGEAIVQFARRGRRRTAMIAQPATPTAERVAHPPIASAVPTLSNTRRTRQVSDRPVLWRELHVPMLATAWRKIILVIFILFALAMTYLAAASERALNEEVTHILYGFTFLLVTLVGTVVVSATTITTEKESRTWELLLTTPLKARSILFGKAMGVLRRMTPTAALFVGHVLLFTLALIIHPLGILHTLLLLVGPMIFLIGTGTYLSLRLKRTTTAVMTNLAVALFLWAALPFLALLMDEAIGMGDDLLELVAAINPFALTAFSFVETADRWEPLSSMDFEWPTAGGDHLSAVEFTLALAAISLAYALAGVGLLAAAAARFRAATRE